MRAEFKGAVPEVENSELSYAPPGPVVEAYHKSKAFVRGIRGPVGSGKSTACLQELFVLGCEQKPYNGRRSTRWGVIRNTYPELRTTTIKTFLDWFPFASVVYDSPIRATMLFKLGDGTVVDQEWLFFSMDEPSDIRKLKSLELTGVFVNEAGEVGKEHVDMATQRIGRYPSKRRGGPTRSCLVMDTNPPDSDSWWHEAEASPPNVLLEDGSEEFWEFFIQPPGMIRNVSGTWETNPNAENRANLPRNYYERIIIGKDNEYIRVFVGNEFGTLISGKPVYTTYNDSLHCRECPPIKGVTIIVGLDYGRSPAAAFMQITPRGQLRIFDEVIGTDVGIGVFARDLLKPKIAEKYPDFNFIFVGDPAGLAKESDERNAFDVLLQHGIAAIPASTNTLTGRLEAVRKYLSILVEGQPGMLISPKCVHARKGFLGKYNFERVSTNKMGVFKDLPAKNSYSHVQDAIQYGALQSSLELNNEGFTSELNYGPSGLRETKGVR
jgi:hypothetical protein